MVRRLSFEQIGEWILVLLVTGAISLVCNLVGYNSGIVESIPGMGIILAICLLGLIVTEFIPGNLPSVCYISLIGILVALPVCPIAPTVIGYVDKVSLMSVVTPLLAYAGVIVGKDWAAFVKIGWKGIFVSLLVLFGTFFTSSMMAQVMMGTPR